MTMMMIQTICFSLASAAKSVSWSTRAHWPHCCVPVGMSAATAAELAASRPQLRSPAGHAVDVFLLFWFRLLRRLSLASGLRLHGFLVENTTGKWLPLSFFFPILQRVESSAHWAHLCFSPCPALPRIVPQLRHWRQTGIK
jgi:hypothetical protein